MRNLLTIFCIAALVIFSTGQAVEAKETITIGYSWGWTNIGDAAIAPGLLNLLSKNFGDHKLQAVTYGNGNINNSISSFSYWRC